MLIWTM